MFCLNRTIGHWMQNDAVGQISSWLPGRRLCSWQRWTEWPIRTLAWFSRNFQQLCSARSEATGKRTARERSSNRFVSQLLGAWSSGIFSGQSTKHWTIRSSVHSARNSVSGFPQNVISTRSLSRTPTGRHQYD